MINRLLSSLFTLLGIGLLGLSGYLYFTDGPSKPQLELTHSDVEVADAVAERATTIVYHYHNPSARPIRILGGNTC